MVTISGVFGEMWDVLGSMAPVGVNPVYFWATALITFALIFIAIQLLPFMQKNKAVAFIAALVFAYFTASSAFVTIIVAKLFPNIGLVLMAILGLLLVVAFISPESVKEGKFTGTKFIAIFAFLVIIWLTYTFAAPQLLAQGYITSTVTGSISEEDLAIVLIILVVIGLLSMLTKKKSKDKSIGKKIWEGLFEADKW